MADVFLMGTAGNFEDKKRSMWREPIKTACAKVGITCFDPVVPEWNEAAMKAEFEALITARVITMAITANTSGFGSLAESGWAALSALKRGQAFGLFVDKTFFMEGFDPRLSQASSDLLNMLVGKDQSKDAKALADASRRARKLVDGHAHELAKQFPELNLFVAEDLESLRDWTVKTALERRAQKIK